MELSPPEKKSRTLSGDSSLPISRFEHEILKRILLITLENPAGSDASGTRFRSFSTDESSLVHLRALADQLTKQKEERLAAATAGGGNPLDSKSLFDRVFIERLSMRSTDVVGYLVGSYHRVKEEQGKSWLQAVASAAGIGSEGVKDLLSHIESVIIGYLGIALTNPDMFPDQAAAPDPSHDGIAASASRFLLEMEGGSVTIELIEKLLTRWQEQEDDPTPLLVSLIRQIHKKASQLDFAAGDSTPFRCLLILSQVKKVAALIVDMPTPPGPAWITGPGGIALKGGVGAARGIDLETQSMLGPFYRLSILPKEANQNPIGEKYTRELKTKQRREADQLLVQAIASFSRMGQGLTQLNLDTLTALLKNSDTREEVLRWLAASVITNSARARLSHRLASHNPMREGTSSDAFIINLVDALLGLCIPFLDPQDPKTSKIDGTYVLSGKRIDFSGETRIAASAEDVNRWVDPRNYARQKQFEARLQGSSQSSSVGDTEEAIQISDQFGTITEFFFITMQALHIGILPMNQFVIELSRGILNMQKELKRLQDMPGSPEAALHLPRLEAELERLQANKLVYDMCIPDRIRIGKIIKFYRLLAVLMVRWAGGKDNGSQDGLPLPSPPKRLFASLPQSFIEDVSEFLTFVSRYIPKNLDEMGTAEAFDFLTFAVTFMSSPVHVTNPYVRAKLVELLSCWVPNESHMAANHRQMFRDMFFMHPLAKGHLMRVLIHFYVDIEFTGSHTQFYDKFTYRHYAAQVFEYLWGMSEYKKSMVRESKEQIFPRFVNMLINDTIWCMDESLAKLMEVKQFERDRSDASSWEAQTAEARQERETTHTRNSDYCRYLMQQANEHVHMIAYLSEVIVDPFLTPELADRVGSMLNYFLMQLVGPKCLELKVADPEKYEFRPKKLLAEIMTVYIHFMGHPVFASAVARDERSYRHDIMLKASRIARREKLLHEEDVRKFEEMSSNVQEVSQQGQSMEDRLGEIPDDFLDPIACELMRDPVILPTSGHSMDRSTIARILLNDESDPFNRQRLTLDMLQPNHDLKAKIDRWMERRLAGLPDEVESPPASVPAAAAPSSSSDSSSDSSVDTKMAEAAAPLTAGSVVPSNDTHPAGSVGGGSRDVEMHGVGGEDELDEDEQTELALAMSLSMS
eukprot:GILJ01012341.1.p1 GENE.GILJ01012341.1~~GILJ01012341.1.p1  ORF type:complete len:1148 (-),score=204.51 GILJ01012341.1:87-3530(-)